MKLTEITRIEEGFLIEGKNKMVFDSLRNKERCGM